MQAVGQFTTHVVNCPLNPLRFLIILPILLLLLQLLFSHLQFSNVQIHYFIGIP